jgi:ferritin-like metal-binding protein YciE
VLDVLTAGEKPKAEECVGFDGLKREHEKLTDESSEALTDFVAAGATARTEHYEIAAYEGLKWAKALGETSRRSPGRNPQAGEGRRCERSRRSRPG